MGSEQKSYIHKSIYINLGYLGLVNIKSLKVDMEFLQKMDVQLVVGIAVAVLAAGVGAAYVISSKKSKGLDLHSLLLV